MAPGSISKTRAKVSRVTNSGFHMLVQLTLHRLGHHHTILQSRQQYAATTALNHNRLTPQLRTLPPVSYTCTRKDRRASPLAARRLYLLSAIAQQIPTGERPNPTSALPPAALRRRLRPAKSSSRYVSCTPLATSRHRAAIALSHHPSHCSAACRRLTAGKSYC